MTKEHYNALPSRGSKTFFVWYTPDATTVRKAYYCEKSGEFNLYMKDEKYPNAIKWDYDHVYLSEADARSALIEKAWKKAFTNLSQAQMSFENAFAAAGVTFTEAPLHNALESLLNPRSTREQLIITPPMWPKPPHP